ncbi:hypothetical protein [Streptomyces sp. NRRL WC-3742]|uniref:hypothetical protein n=1 Tax=Streptomyces sp. NRRL WC-3742 TaxID=1463934 RepID=UPI00068BCFE7|nr:hypothetical protein [Streptomyces sp. NRRL WC-3742]
MTITTAAIPAQPAPTDREHGSRTIAALEAAWAAIQANHPDVPNVVMITGMGRSGKGITWGHFGADFWTVQQGERNKYTPELFAGGELLSLGGERTVQTLLHEAAHGVAYTRRIKDTSSSGRYHNRRFAALAAELGLIPPVTPCTIRGLSECTITPAAVERYADVIKALDEARLPYIYDPQVIALAGVGRPAPTTGTEGKGGEPTSTPGTGGEGDDEGSEGGDYIPTRPKKRAPTRFLVICGCTKPGKGGSEAARRIQISQAVWEFGGEDGGLNCGRCGQPFRKADED